MTAQRITGAIGSSLGTLGNIALTFEKAGKIAGRFGMVGSLICGFLELIIPPADQPPPVTKQDLTDAMKDLKGTVIQALWLDKADDVSTRINTFNDGFQKMWIGLTKVQLESIKDSAGTVIGSRPVLNQSTYDLDENGNDVFNAYFLPKGDAADKLDLDRHTLEDAKFEDTTPLTSAQLATRAKLTMELYVLLGSMSVAYYQASVAYRWGKEMLIACQWLTYKKDHQDWSDNCDANPNYAKTHAEADLLNPYPNLRDKLQYDPNFLNNYSVPVWQKWVQNAALNPVLDMQDYIDKLIAFATTGTPATATAPAKPGFYTDYRRRWDALEAAVATDPPFPAGYKPSWIEFNTGMSLAFSRMDAWSQALQDNDLEGVEEDDILAFGTAIDAWRTMRATVSFSYYTTVKATETLTSVATDQYGDGSLAAKIAQYNPDVKLGVNAALPLGTELKIFDKAWLPYVDIAAQIWPRPKVAA